METRRGFRGRWATAAWGLTLACLFAGSAGATVLVDCDTPDDFCTGDPCVTADAVEITVASCVLDFSPRALVLAEKVAVPNGGVLSLTAGSIEVDKGIDGKHVTSLEGDGADVSLIASGHIVIDKRIDVSGKLTNGTILVDAGGNVTLNQRLRARAKGSGATATGGTVTVQADGTVTSIKKGKIEVRGKKNSTAGGAISVSGQNGVTLAGRLDARGTPGGGVTLSSSAGTVTLSEEIRAGGESAAGGTAILSAAGGVDVTDGKVTVNGDGADAGTVLVTAGGLADLSFIYARGLVGGTVAATAADVHVFRASVRGNDDAGSVSLTSTTGDVSVDNIDGRAGTGTGGQADISAADDATVLEALLDGDAEGGDLHVNAVGDIVLGAPLTGRIDATGAVGGEIEAEADGNLTAVGQIRAAAGGCIGLSADLVLDISGATFDVPLTASCP